MVGDGQRMSRFWFCVVLAGLRSTLQFARATCVNYCWTITRGIKSQNRGSFTETIRNRSVGCHTGIVVVFKNAID